MKIVHISDLHFGKRLNEHSLLDDQKHWCENFYKFLGKNPHHVVVIAGDLYDRAVPPQEAVTLMSGFLMKLLDMGLVVVAITGNHDSQARMDFVQPLLREKGLYLAAVPKLDIDIVTIEKDGQEIDFWLVPFITPTDVNNMFVEGGYEDEKVVSFDDGYKKLIGANLHRKRDGVDSVLVAHGCFTYFTGKDDVEVQCITSDSELNIGGAEMVDGKLFKDFTYCAFGHYHTPQRVHKDTSNTMLYSGSPLKYSISEEKHKKGFYSVDISSGEVSANKESFLPRRDVRKVCGTIGELSEGTNGMLVSNDYVWVDVVLEDNHNYGSIISIVKNLYPNYIKINYIYKKNDTCNSVDDSDIKQISSKSMVELFKDFYDNVNDSSLSVVQENVVMEIYNFKDKE